jgi:hypothetical protein
MARTEKHPAHGPAMPPMNRIDAFDLNHEADRNFGRLSACYGVEQRCLPAFYQMMN